MKIKNQKSMTYLFTFLIILYAAFALYFIINNNFNKEINPILFPTIGAILFSFYLGINAIYINKPGKREFEIPIAVLYDLNSGNINSMTNFYYSKDLLEFSDYSQGIRTIEDIHLYNKIGRASCRERV